MLSLVNKNTFLSLVCLGIGHSKGSIPQQVNWKTVEALAKEQGLSAVVLNAMERLPEGRRPPKPQLLQWIGDALQNYEHRYGQYEQAIAGLAGFYNAHGFRMMVLKGYGCSLDWPRPSHRPCGDIDIWLFGQYREADAALAKECGVKIDHSHHHHTVFSWRGFAVENHYDFVNIHGHKSSRELERLFKQLGVNDSYSVEVNGEKVYLPSPNLHALFLQRHMVSHFASTSISLRQLLDWAFFVKAHGTDVDWLWLEDVLTRFGMMQFYMILNAICVEDLGFDRRLFPIGNSDAALKGRVLDDILSPEFTGESPQNVFRRSLFKYRRWRANAWKHRLCYKESMWSAFWSGVWNHLLKPSSI